jgi:hypothetical protein
VTKKTTTAAGNRRGQARYAVAQIENEDHRSAQLHPAMIATMTAALSINPVIAAILVFSGSVERMPLTFVSTRA